MLAATRTSNVGNVEAHCLWQSLVAIRYILSKFTQTNVVWLHSIVSIVLGDPPQTKKTVFVCQLIGLSLPKFPFKSHCYELQTLMKVLVFCGVWDQGNRGFLVNPRATKLIAGCVSTLPEDDRYSARRRHLRTLPLVHVLQWLTGCTSSF